MNAEEFAELVDWVTDRWGSADEVWANPASFAKDFATLPADEVWAAVYRVGNGNWAPRPMTIRADALTQMRLAADPARDSRRLDAPPGGSWAEWSMRCFGEVRSLMDVVRERHAETEGMFVEDTEARLPGDSGLIEDGARPTIECRSPSCDIHHGGKPDKTLDLNTEEVPVGEQA